MLSMNIKCGMEVKFVDSKSFKSILKEEFVPKLREYGFKGSGFKYIKPTDNHYIYIVSIFGDRMGKSCSLEIGVYIDFIPLHNELIPRQKWKSLSTADCDFRKDINSPSMTGTWFFGKSEQETRNTVRNMVTAFEKVGIPYFEQFSEFPEPFDNIQLEEIINEDIKLEKLGSPTNLRLARIMGMIHLYLGNSEESIKFAEWGLDNIGVATGLLNDFQRIKEGSFFKELHH